MKPVSKFTITLCTASFLLINNAFAGHEFSKSKCTGYSIGTIAEYMPSKGNNIGPGSLVADAMLTQSKYRGSNVAIIGASEIRSDLLPGALTKSEIRRLVLNTPLVTFDLTGQELISFIEKMAVKRNYTNLNNTGIHVAGMRFTFDKNAVSGQKVKELEIGSLDKGYLPNDPSRSVRVITSIYALNDLVAIKGKRFLWNVTFERMFLQQILENHIVSLQNAIVNCPENRINITSARVMVFSDPHYFEPSLLISNGPAFQTYLAQDRKLIAESHAILMSTVSAIRKANPDICLIPGDLTKDGELLSHSGFNQIITDSLLSAGIKVYVAPGNHDINNNEALSYNGNVTLPVESISAEAFAELNDNLGFGDAIARDSSSLTYIAEPLNGLWILSIDACKYGQNGAHSETGGALSEGTLSWILDKLDYARKHNITVFGMMHHGVTEHYTGQTQIMMEMFKDYVIDNWMNVRDTLAAHGLKVVFSGHYHAQDIVKYSDTKGNFVFDIETGSTVTWPCPIRTAELSVDRTLDISTSFIDSINYQLPVLSFRDYAKNYLVQGLTGMVNNILTMQFGAPAQMAQMISPAVASAFCAHYAGDELPGPVEIGTYSQLKMSPDPLIASMGSALESLWTDLQPGDNTCKINLTNGSIR